jgi:serine/threonine protein kinase
MHRYKLLERVGTGGYSEVFRTLDQQTGKLCALKVMKQPYEKFRASQDL